MDIVNFWFGHNMLTILNEPLFTPRIRWWENAIRNSGNNDVPMISYGGFFGTWNLNVM